MNRQKNTLLIKKIANEYINFMKETKAIINETKRATVLALKKALNLQDGESILINEDGSIEILPIDTEKKGVFMLGKDKDGKSDKEIGGLTLNGKAITKEELDHKKELYEGRKGVKFIEVSKGNFKMRLND